MLLLALFFFCTFGIVLFREHIPVMHIIVCIGIGAILLCRFAAFELGYCEADTTNGDYAYVSNIVS